MSTEAPVKFRNEAEFEDAVIFNLTHKYGWSPDVLTYATEDQLIANWARIVFENNNTPDRLNGVPLSPSRSKPSWTRWRHCRIQQPCSAGSKAEKPSSPATTHWTRKTTGARFR
ncbi:hypothetical protein JKI95_06970 [Corynebacterium aquatimens]|uniref:hypothetical protein n=1 Tax=Corynebacterium aquatimens TaxID=1190508 RepID=UPI002541324E|nr:hypothetical protein [Corynebacterium aquatimens]QYH19030.1 hypothetical protein JKI95_06970 [Corynebacterium aquatimens]